MKILLIIILFLNFCQAHAQLSDSVRFISVTGDTIYIDRKDERTFTKAEIEPEFNGGQKAWDKFLKENLDHPPLPFSKNKRMKGTVALQFIVLADGRVVDMEGIYGNEVLIEAAIRAMKKTPNWIPARQNGTKVNCYKKLVINFD